MIIALNITFSRRIRVFTNSGRLLRPIVASPQSEYPFIPFRLILNINTCLFAFIHLVWLCATKCKVFRVIFVIKIDGWCGSKAGIDIITHPHEVYPCQQSMLDVTCSKLTFKLGINAKVL
ncbi:Uncharacterised protein [Shigella sonnei]|nr:Uncharacterised protein [Shigella sonnei]CSR36253.1 Uncharacterised protein [Shigella sonnei]